MALNKTCTSITVRCGGARVIARLTWKDYNVNPFVSLSLCSENAHESFACALLRSGYSAIHGLSVWNFNFTSHNIPLPNPSGFTLVTYPVLPHLSSSPLWFSLPLMTDRLPPLPCVLHPFSLFSVQTLDRFCFGCLCQVVSLLKLSRCLFVSPWSNSHSSENESHCLCVICYERISQCYHLHSPTPNRPAIQWINSPSWLCRIYSHRPLFQECSSQSHSFAWPSHPSKSQPHFPLSIKGGN